MAIQQSIRSRGFRKWYERQLLVGHSHLLLLLLCTLALLGAFEAFSQPGAERALIVVALLVAAVLGGWALRRYLFLLMRAEVIANQAVCPQCKAYARWEVDEPVAQSGAGSAHPVDAADEDAEDDGSSETMRVCCRKCQHRWRISW